MKRTVFILVATVGFALAPSVARAQPHLLHGWGNGSVVTIQEVREASHSNARAEIAEYVIAPVDEVTPLNEGEEGFGPFDLVVNAPRQNGGSYSSNLRVFLVLPSDGAPEGRVASRTIDVEGDAVPFAYAADLGGGIVPLTSVARVQQAAALGLVELVDTGIVEVCHVSAGH